MKSKKKYKKLSLSLVLVIFLTTILPGLNIKAGTEGIIVLEEHFDALTATVSPNDWKFSNTGVYASGGLAKPSAKLATTGASITTKSFSLTGDAKLKFFLRGNAASGTTPSSLLLEKQSGGQWFILDSISTFTSGETKEYALTSDVTAIKYTFTKGNYNVAIDDIVITQNTAVQVINVSGISIPDTLSIKEEESKELTATVIPTDATNKNVKWASEDATIATVENGKVIGVKEGITKVTATSEDGNFISSCNVTVVKKIVVIDPPPVDTSKENYNIYYGQLHSHTTDSDGQGTPEEAYTYARDKGKLDFFAITDHSNSFDNDTACNITDGSASTEWKRVHELADKYNQDNKFVAIAGYEMTWSKGTGGYGHMNTFNSTGFETRNNKTVDLKSYYSKISEQPQTISQFNHPGDTFGDFDDFSFYSPTVDNVINLIEVGNGEGAIRSSGYFQSYDYYTRALDKGWHVAPTNNQDNHKGKWGSANDGRTVILAEDLTRDSFYDAIRQHRVYATEDKNLAVKYYVNDSVMGSTLKNPEKLDIKISFKDSDANDTVKKVSIIANGGTVVESKTFDTVEGNWDLQLDSKYNYYYLKIEQADKDIAVTAPVWTSQVTPIGISKVEVSQNPQIVNTATDITASLYNNSTEALSNVKVEFFKDAIAPENKLSEETIATIAAANTATSKYKWTPEKAGSYTIYAQMTATLEGSQKVFSQSTPIKVFNAGEIKKVVVDAGHFNQYVSGQYTGSILGLDKLVKAKDLMLVQNTGELTASVLEGVPVLIITDPQGYEDTKYKLTKSKFTESELKVIKNFVNNGGTLIITSRADYDDKKVTADSSYQNSAQGNSVLEAVGSNLRLNDDEIVDDTANGGQNFRLYFNKYLSTKYGLTNNIVDGTTYSAYSGCSVNLKAGGSDKNVDWLVKGHDTTYSLDSDLAGDATTVAKGDVGVLAAEVLPSGGKVIVSGTTFFSDYEINATDNAYSNATIVNNILSWATAPSQVNISEIRKDENKDGIYDNLGKKFVVEGTVTSASAAAVKNTAFFDCMYIQDKTGGTNVFGLATKALQVGTKVRVTGTVKEYEGDLELGISDENTDVVILDSNVQSVGSTVLSTKESMLKEKQGLLIKTQGKVTKITDNEIFLDDGSGEARIFLNGYIGDNTDNFSAVGKWDSTIKVGDTVSAIGLGSQDLIGSRLRVRNSSEIVKVTEQTKPSTVIIDNNTDKSVVIDAIKDAKTIHINTSTTPIVSKDIFNLIKGTDKVITFEGKNVRWSIKGSDINADIMQDIDLSLKVVNDELSSKIIKAYGKDKPITAFSFNYDGALPGMVTLRIFVGTQWRNKQVSVYRYYPENDKVELIKDQVMVDSEGYVKYETNHCSDYFVTEVESSTNATPTATSITTGVDGNNITSSLPITGDKVPIIIFIVLCLISTISMIVIRRKKLS